MSNIQSPDAYLLQQMALAGDSQEYADRFQPGEHIVALNVFELKDTTDYGRIASVDFIVLESNVPGYAGRPAGEGFFISASDAKGGKAAKQRAFSLAKAIVLSLGGNPDDQTVVGQVNGQAVTAGMVLVQNTMTEMLAPNQPWRGVVLRASASAKTSKNTKKEYTRVTYGPIPQTAEAIGLVRKRIESAAVPTPGVQGAAPMIGGQPAGFQQTAVAPPPATTMAPPAGFQQAQPMIQTQTMAPAPGGFASSMLKPPGT